MFAGTLLPYTQYVIYFTAGFLLIPTGRDFIAPRKALLPGDEKLLAAMTGSKPTNDFMWRVFGCNFVFLSLAKFLALSMGVAAMSFFALFAAYGTIAVGVLFSYRQSFLDAGADITPFFAMFILETLAWYATIFA